MAGLLEQLSATGLLTEEQLAELARLPEASNPDPRALGKVLLQRNWLTRFQINEVAQGRGKGLRIGVYLVMERLGEGGMGQVLKARHEHMGRVVALKLMRKEKLQSADSVARFYQEVKAAAALIHPNIVLAFDAGQAGQTHFFSMEYVEGADLARLVHKHGPLPVPQACEYIRQAALGLQHAHERGLVHRDIKPSNLLVSQADGQPPVVKVLDLGLARLGNSFAQERGLTRMGQMLGTPDYLAPEQALDARNVDIRADIYSLGCTLFFLLVGRAPFQAEALAELLMKHQMDAVPSVREARPDVPEALDNYLRRMMAKKPEQRPAIPSEVAAALAPLARGEKGGALLAAAAVPIGRIPPPPLSGDDFASLTADDGVGPRSISRDRSRDTLTEAPAKARKRAAEPVVKKDSRLPILIGAAVGGAMVLLLTIGVLLYLLLAPGKPVEQTAQPAIDPKGATTPIEKPKEGPPPIDPPKDPPVVKPVEDGTLFGAIEAAIKGGTTARSKLLGGGFGGGDFDDVPQEGALLTGLEVGLGKFGPNDVIHSLRPIYQSRKGRIFGALHGDVQSRVVTVEAKAGYAVACLTVKVGAGLDGMVVTFMAIDGKRLDPARVYQSAWIGGPGGFQAYSLVGDGTPIIGIFGRVNNTTTGLGVVSIEPPRGPPNIPPITVPTPGSPALAARVPGEVKGVNLPRGAAPLRFAGSSGRAVLIEQTRAQLYDLDRFRILKTFSAGKFMRCLDVSADGKTLALGASDGTVALWDVETGNAGHVLQHENSMAYVAFSPDGKLLAATTSAARIKKDPSVAAGKKIVADYGVQLWNVETGTPEHRFPGTKTSIRAIEFSADGKLLLASNLQRPLLAWDVQSHRALPGCDKVPLQGALKLAAVDGSQVLLGASTGEILLWDLAGARVVRTFRGHTTAIYKMAVLPGGKQFVSIAGLGGLRGQPLVDATLRLWDIEKGDEVGRTSFPEVPRALSVSPDGKQALVSALGGSVRLIDLGKLPRPTAPVVKSATPPRPEDRFMGHAGAVTSVAYSSDGKYLLSGGADGTARLWDVATGGEIHKVPVGGEVTRVCFSADGQRFAVFTAGRCQVHLTSQGTLTSSLPSAGTASGALAPDGQEIIFTGSKFLRVRSLQNLSGRLSKKAKTTCAAYAPDSAFYTYGDELGFVHVHSNPLKKDVGSYQTHTAAVECLAAHGGTTPRIASGGADNLIFVRSGIKLNRLIRLSGHTATVTGLSLSADGKLLASGSEDKSVRVWDAATGKPLHKFTDEKEIQGVAFSPDGKVVVSCGSKGMRFWNLTTSAKP